MTRVRTFGSPNERIQQPLRVGVGGPVGSGKTALMEQLCKRLRDELEVAAITNDIYTKEDARSSSPAPGAFRARADHAVSRRAVAPICDPRSPRLDQPRRDRRHSLLNPIIPRTRRAPHRLARRQSCGHLSAGVARHHDLRHSTCRAAKKIPRKGGPGITRSDLLGDQQDRFAPLVSAPTST